MRRFIFIFCCLLIAHTGYSAILVVKKDKAKSTKPAVLRTDSSSVSTRSFDDAALKAYSKSPEFQYKEETTDISWWNRFWRWFWNWISHLFSFNGKGLSMIGIIWQVIEIILLAAGVAALVFFIFKLAGMNLLTILQRKPDAVPIPYSEFFEDINQINFDAEIENAVAKNNYRFAVRLLYLKCLKQLSDSGLIAWQIDKTNSTYINELTNEEQRDYFKTLTRQFEYVWYGEFLIDSLIYKNIDSSFRDFNRRVG